MRRLKVAAFNCSLKSESDRENSSTDALLGQLMKEFAKLGAEGSVVRAVDRNIKVGVRSDAKATPGRTFANGCSPPTS
jgi:hypothetical protein